MVWPNGPRQGFEILVVDSEHGGERMHHQPLADQARRIGKSVREARGGREQQKARRADAVGANDHHSRLLPALAAVLVDIDGAGRQPAVVDLDVPNPRAGYQTRAVFDRMRPEGDIGGGFGALGTTGHAGAAQHAGIQPVVGNRGNGVGPRPPVPAELVEATGRLAPDLADRQRRRREVAARRIGRVAWHAGDADLVLDLVEEREQFLVCERPVVGDTIQRFHPEV